jgi:hypothetical protein
MISNNQVLVRFFYYADVNMGMGDAGTACYKLLNKKLILQKQIGKINFKYLPDAVWKIIGLNHIECGFQIVDKSILDKEIKQLEKNIVDTTKKLNLFYKTQKSL